MYIYICNVLCHCQNYFKTTCIPLLLPPQRFLCSQVMGFNYPHTKPDQPKKIQQQQDRLSGMVSFLGRKEIFSELLSFHPVPETFTKLQVLIPVEEFFFFFKFLLFVLCFVFFFFYRIKFVTYLGRRGHKDGSANRVEKGKKKNCWPRGTTSNSNVGLLSKTEKRRKRFQGNVDRARSLSPLECK